MKRDLQQLAKVLASITGTSKKRKPKKKRPARRSRADAPAPVEQPKQVIAPTPAVTYYPPIAPAREVVARRETLITPVERSPDVAPAHFRPTCGARCAETGLRCALPAHPGEHAAGRYRFLVSAEPGQTYFPRAAELEAAASRRFGTEAA